MDEICVVTTVVDARPVADVLAAAAVAGRLAACAQVGAQVDSTYWWQSAIQTTPEWSVQFKTAPDRVAALVDHVRAAHPYDVPEILVGRVGSGNPDYAAWVYAQTRPYPAQTPPE
ncbi:divalent-cation tolerance protein CutA [Micromonospora sp. CPCC 206060]|uniref:divalent-cation tolerance protein CutA n=1 Tax=Micromonospora sp. CPCC 206060 TaxID=3122406 RepID=UPI002FEFC7D9